MNVNLNLTKLINYLESNNVSQENINSIENIWNTFDAMDDNIDGNISSEKGFNAFQQWGMAHLTNLKDLFINFIQQNSIATAPVQETNTQKIPATAEEIEADKAQLKQNIDKVYLDAQKELIAQLETSGLTFEFNGKSFDAKVLADTLKNMEFYTHSYGTAEADKKNNRILVNETPTDGTRNLYSFEFNPSKADAMKTLLHEALHVFYNKQGADPGFDTQEEEMFVEKQAIILASQMKNHDPKSQIDNPKIYGIPLSELGNNPELDTILKTEFIEAGYRNRPQNSSGDIMLSKYKKDGDKYLQDENGRFIPEEEFTLKNGYTIHIDNQEVGKIGGNPQNGGYIFDQLGVNSISLGGEKDGSIVFEYQNGALPIEVKDNEGNVKFSAYILRPESSNEIAFNNGSNSISLKKGFSINIDGKNYIIGQKGVELQALDGCRGQLAILGGESPELISDSLIFDNVEPNSMEHFHNKQYKPFYVLDKNGVPLYSGKMYY